ncbi:Myosin heavy chain-related protein [Thalictrum thalictroides]|uniref:Myosin heavy chain-related protein n=1 Tax=Thalictrum thalictroides TaxID=46969 RepID=A0A7J6VW32_THATH|nr:Myosin heavy chain-related protein [Thalictrum thalictroides]
MFKSTRWRSEKNKIKVVFKLQFHTTQVPQLAKDSLMVSLVPVEVGKPTVRLEKSVIQDGTCRWENPIYETIKFTQEPKTGKISEKIYQFIVSTGSSKAGVLGEVTFDFANYFELIKPSLVSLPLKPSISAAILHVTIQRMYGAVDQRDAEENGMAENISHDRSLRRKMSDCDTDENRNCNSIEDVSVNKTTSENSETNGNLIACKSSDGISASDSENSSERNTPRELGLKNNNVHRDPGSFLSSLSNSSMPHKPTTNAIITNYLEHQRSNTEWSVGSAPDGSVDDSTNSSDDILMKERSPHASDTSVEKLRSDLVILARQAEVSEIEIQTLRKQIVKESKRGQDLARDVISLKEERDALKQECEQLKSLRKHNDDTKVSSKLQFQSGDSHTLLKEIRQELDCEKDLNANLRIQLQKTQESNSELLLAVQDLDEMLEQKNSEISYLSSKSVTNGNAEKRHELVSNYETDDDEEQRALESLVKEHDDAKDIYLLEQKIIDLYSEIEVYRRDRDELEMQMEQLALDYEILKQENHDLMSKLEQSHLQEQLKAQYECSDSLTNLNELETQIESLENELKKQEEDFSASLITINELKSQVEYLEKELEKQAQGYEADLDTVMHAKVEQEQRAIRAEEALRKTRLTNANTAERLQEEFRRLSIQMSSTFDANEKVAMKAVTEANELRLQKSHLEEMLDTVNEELSYVRDQYEEKLKELSNQIDLTKEQSEHRLLELEEKSRRLEQQKEQEEKTRDAFSKEILMLRDEIEKLAEDKNNLSKQAEQKEKLEVEIEKMKASITEAELLVQRGINERNELENRIATVSKEADMFLKELNSTRSSKDEKETLVGILQSEVETLKSQYNDLKHSLFEDELEKENLKRQVFSLKGELKKKEEIITSTEKKLKGASDGSKSPSKNSKAVPARGSKEITGLRERIKLLEGQIKLKETALENSNHSFLKKEKDLQYKIEELETRMVALSHSSSSYEDQLQKEIQRVEALTESSNKDGLGIDDTSLDSQMGATAYLSVQNSIKSTNKNTLDKLLISTSQSGDYRDLDELLSEMALMKARNETMEGELKDMQNRYSAISLKFAEVEGERQQLVMTVRNLKKN